MNSMQLILICIVISLQFLQNKFIIFYISQFIYFQLTLFLPLLLQLLILNTHLPTTLSIILLLFLRFFIYYYSHIRFGKQIHHRNGSKQFCLRSSSNQLDGSNLLVFFIMLPCHPNQPIPSAPTRQYPQKTLEVVETTAGKNSRARGVECMPKKAAQAKEKILKTTYRPTQVAQVSSCGVWKVVLIEHSTKIPLKEETQPISLILICFIQAYRLDWAVISIGKNLGQYKLKQNCKIYGNLICSIHILEEHIQNPNNITKICLIWSQQFISLSAINFLIYSQTLSNQFLFPQFLTRQSFISFFQTQLSSRILLFLFLYNKHQFSIMNYPKNQPLYQNSTQSTSTIGAMQAYITELTLYINENNEKYTKNLEILKQFYEQQINQLNDNIVDLDQQLLMNRNQNISFKDVLQNKNLQIEQLKTKIEQLKVQIQGLNETNNQEKQKNSRVYQHMDRLRQQMQGSIDKEMQKANKIDEQKSTLLISLKEKQAQIRINHNTIKDLQQKVAQRFSLPERMKDMEIQAAKDKTNIINLQEKVIALTKQRDYSQTQLERKRKQNQKLQIQANKSKGDLSYEIEVAVKKQKQRLTEQIENLKIENERKIFQIKDLELKLKQQIQINQKLELSISQLNENNRKKLSEIKELQEDKSVYLNEFRKLKSQYEEVINNLEAAIPEYQKKNWSLQQQNQQLNSQLESLQQLLRQLRAMNDLQPLRKQYRQWSELHLAADRKLPEQNLKPGERKEQRSYLPKSDEVEVSPQWQKLMQEIQRIQI